MQNEFQARHIGPRATDLNAMLKTIGVSSLDQLIDETVPANIRLKKSMNIGAPKAEYQYLQELKSIAQKNKVFKSYIGLGYFNTIVPGVIQRNIFENPGWYTQYTPYQAEISQGRLEALLNFQTMITDLTGLPVANASLLDEGTAAAEAMHLLHDVRSRAKGKAIDVIKGRALPLNFEIVVGNASTFEASEEYFALLVQYPNGNGEIVDYSSIIKSCKEKEVYLVMAADILSLALLTSPGELGADIAIGNSQRFGVPMGFGGPHAAFLNAKKQHPIFVRHKHY